MTFKYGSPQQNKIFSEILTKVNRVFTTGRLTANGHFPVDKTQIFIIKKIITKNYDTILNTSICTTAGYMLVLYMRT